MRVTLIIAAGGQGIRFHKGLSSLPRNGRGGTRSKLFFPLHGRSILEATVETFQEIPEILETILVAPPLDQAHVRSLVRKRHWRNVKMVPGGATRAESVRNGLRKAHPKSDWIMVHDAARPLISPETVRALFSETKNAEGVILGKRMVPTVKKVSPEGWIEATVDRSTLREAETPQLVRRDFLEQAYQSPEALKATDEASLLEALGGRVKVVPHEGFNPKITTVRDLELARAYLMGPGPNYRGQAPILQRTGLGKDIHRLVPKRPFYLGAVRIPFAKGPLGHSDGDALLHAIADAILGAIGAGDIGEWFSDRNPRFKNIRSAKMVEAVLKEARRRGWRPVHVDTIVHLEKPRLSPYKKKIRKSIAALLGLEEEAVSVKAKTMEGLGPVGQGDAVSADALVTLEKVSL